jgi:hypothetical protein
MTEKTLTESDCVTDYALVASVAPLVSGAVVGVSVEAVFEATFFAGARLTATLLAAAFFATGAAFFAATFLTAAFFTAAFLTAAFFAFAFLTAVLADVLADFFAAVFVDFFAGVASAEAALVLSIR